jgi:cytochrome P450
VETYPKTRLRDLSRLIGLLVRTRRRGGDLSEAVAGWLRGLTEQYQSPNIVIDLIFRRILFVSGHELSAHVLALPPSSHAFVAGSMKKKAMSFLAPHALTILQDDEWRAFRTFNEEVLQTGMPHDHLAFILAQVEKAFSQPVRDIDEIRQRMGQVMLVTVFGEGNAPPHLIGDIQELFAEVSPRTAVLGSRKGALRDRFRGELGRLWQSGAGTTQPALLALAHKAAQKLDGTYRREELLVSQIPHWMFTFTNSGSDLLGRSLAMITARQETLARVRQEVSSVGRPSEVENVHRSRYLEACLRETGRLYPPVVQTAHRAARSSSCGGVDIPAGTELLHYFPVNNRNTSVDSLANHFRPERWLDPGDPVHKRAPNLFLTGARACPGRDLILFIVKAAIAVLLRDGSIPAKRSILTDDPLPFSFPSECVRFEPTRR